MKSRCTQEFTADQDLSLLKQQILLWCDQHSYCCFLDSHHYSNTGEEPRCLAAAGVNQIFLAEGDPGNLLEEAEKCNDWLFGHFSYHSFHSYYGLPQPIMPGGSFAGTLLFCPVTVIEIIGNRLIISTLEPSAETIWNSIRQIDVAPLHQPLPPVQFSAELEPDMYIKKVETLLDHIRRGDCYEINFCQEYFAVPITIPALNTYVQLMEISPNPFSCFYKNDGNYVLCASPERFLQKKGNQIRSQPIKGTIRRNTTNREQDELLQKTLLNDTKNQSENIMVVDLVRNDLSRICREGTVRVTELLGLHSFPQVHQLISTVEGELLPGTKLLDVLKATFPMGSMTGAPKKKVMELIEEYEVEPRGIYSGSIGYITPQKDFDWNVVIRSLVYLSSQEYLSYHVGGGITANSDPKQEWDECQVKAGAIQSLWKK